MSQQIPEILQQKLISQYGTTIANEITDGFAPKPVTFRVNTLKTDVQSVLTQLENEGLQLEGVDFSPTAFIVKGSEENHMQIVEIIKELPVFINGEIYLQSLSAMMPAIVLDPKPGETILDMTAAPGGKTSQLAVLSSGLALITACERDSIRCQRLQHNVDTQGCRKVSVINQDARQLSDFFSFDKILLDAPCTGSGTITPDEDKPRRMTADWVSKINKTQHQLMKKAVQLLKKGHEMVYSTCSVMESENEDIVRYAVTLGCQTSPITDIDLSHIPCLPVTMDNVVCVKPNELYEGFFIARLIKK